MDGRGVHKSRKESWHHPAQDFLHKIQTSVLHRKCTRIFSFFYPPPPKPDMFPAFMVQLPSPTPFLLSDDRPLIG